MTKLNKQNGKKPDYRVLFILGSIPFSMGIFFTLAISQTFLIYMGVGATLMMIGLANRDKWAESKKSSNET